jgi:leucyl/phenylalanyl-tRNA--protein transferase
MAIYKLSKEIAFPHPELSDEDGLLAFGGDLSLERLLLAYENGIFPWYNKDEPILWWCPKPRFILYPEDIKVSKSMKKILQRKEFDVTFDRNFEDVISNCKQLREDKGDGTWIYDEMKEAYINLFRRGFASSVEVYKEGQLVGGLYGVKIGKCFFGESMFSKINNSSKVALIHLANKLREEGFLFIDCQVHTNHLESMGAKFIPWEEFKELLKRGTRM